MAVCIPDRGSLISDASHRAGHFDSVPGDRDFGKPLGAPRCAGLAACSKKLVPGAVLSEPRGGIPGQNGRCEHLAESTEVLSLPFWLVLV